MLREIVTDFVLFSGIEGFIFCLFFEKVGECRRFKWYEWLILSVGNCLISQLLPPLLYQAGMITWMIIFLHITNKTKYFYGFKTVLKAMIFLLVCEMLFAMFYDFVLGLDFTDVGNTVVFLMTIPIRFTEIILIRRYEVMKVWIGGVVRK